jgi:hypothetical protein
MNYSQLCSLKEKLLVDVTNNTRREDFPNEESYHQFIMGTEEGIIRFFMQSMLYLMESDESLPLKKSA